MTIASVSTLAELTTLHVGGPAGAYVETSTEAELIDVVRTADDAGQPLLMLGGGSNLLVADSGFGGVVVRDRRSGIDVESADTCGGVSFTAPAGHSWDDLVQQAVAEEWVGVEALSGVPGTVGAAPVQNIGAYGQEFAGVVASVRVWDRGESRIRTFAAGELGFGYRTSLLKRSMRAVDDGPWYPSPRYIVLDVAFQARLGSLSAPIEYRELATRLGVEVGERAPATAVRTTVLELRAAKGMLLDEASFTEGEPDHDRWSAGSFFTNPLVPVQLADQLPEGAPRFPVRLPVPATTTGPSLGAVDPEVVKTSAAWLIEHAGFEKGFGVYGPRSAARLSPRHALAVTNRGGASSEDIVELARTVRNGVSEKFGVLLEPEPVLIGVSL